MELIGFVQWNFFLICLVAAAEKPVEEPQQPCEDVEITDVEDVPPEEFNSFQYWRDPLPPLNLDEPMLLG